MYSPRCPEDIGHWMGPYICCHDQVVRTCACQDIVGCLENFLTVTFQWVLKPCRSRACVVPQPVPQGRCVLGVGVWAGPTQKMRSCNCAHPTGGSVLSVLPADKCTSDYRQAFCHSAGVNSRSPALQLEEPTRDLLLWVLQLASALSLVHASECISPPLSHPSASVPVH